MPEPNQNQEPNQQGGGESQGGVQTPPPQTPPQQTQSQEELPSELSSLGFKSVKDVIGYMSEVTEDAKRSKTMYKTLTEQVSGRQHPIVDDTPDDDAFVQSPRASTEKVVQKMHRQFEERMTPFMNQVVEGNVTMQKMVLKGDPVYGAVMPELEAELDEYLRTIPAELKVRNNAVKTALEYVIGKNFPKVAKKYNEASARQGAASEGGSNSTGGSVGGKQTTQLPEDERVSAERQIKAGVFKDMEDYIKWRDS